MPRYRFPLSIAALTAAVIIACAFVPNERSKPWENNPTVKECLETTDLLSGASKSAGAETRLEKSFDYQLKQYQDSVSTLQTNLFLQAGFILFGLVVLFGTNEMGELPVIKLKLRRSWLYFIVPAALLFLWLRFGFLLDSLIKTRLYGWELFLELTPAGGSEYVRSGGALLEDSGFMDGWFALFRDRCEHLIDPKLVALNKFLIFPVVFGILLAANHALIVGMAYIGNAPLLKRKEKNYAVLRAVVWFFLWGMFLILVVSNVLFYFGGPNPNWFQVLVPAVAVGLLFLLIFFSRLQKQAKRRRTAKRLRRASKRTSN